MRLTNVLLRQHLGWHAKMKWRHLKHRTIPHEKSVANVKEMGVPLINAVQEFIPRRTIPDPPAEFLDPPKMSEIPRNEFHPLWNSRTCHIFGDKNVLITGKKQAQVLTKTLLVNELPERVQELASNVNITNDTEVQIKNSILFAHLFEAHQEKLAKKKHPEKRMWVFPRDYGITDQRKNKYITDKLLQYCEKLCDASIISQRKVLNNAWFVVPFENNGNLIQFQKTAESLVVSKHPLKPIENISNAESELPSIYPLSAHISIDKENFYELQNIYPIGKGRNFEHPHTAFVHYTPLDVFNCTLEPVTDDQVESRVMLKAFTIAAAKAQSIYGADVRDLPAPITLQCIQVHVNKFYFGVYQLNTLSLDGSDGVKNYWFNVPPMQLYDKCEYIESRPMLVNYNNDVLRHTLAFYQNQ